MMAPVKTATTAESCAAFSKLKYSTMSFYYNNSRQLKISHYFLLFILLCNHSPKKQTNKKYKKGQNARKARPRISSANFAIWKIFREKYLECLLN